MFFALANAIVALKSDGCDALTEYATMFPSVHCSLSGVKGSHVSLATAAAIIEEDDPSLSTFEIMQTAKSRAHVWVYLLYEWICPLAF